MRNLLFLCSLLFLIACESENSKKANLDSMSPLSKVTLLDLDRVPIYPNDVDIRDLLKNPDDLSDENMNNQLYELSEAVKPLITDYNFNQIILTLARKNDNNTASFAELKAAAPNYYKRIDANLAPSSIASIQSQMVYEPAVGDSQQYQPGIHIPNLKLADANRQPLLSSQLEYTGRDERMEEFILCFYENGEAGFEGIWVGPHTADVSTNPIFVIDNSELNTKGQNSKILSNEQVERSTFRSIPNAEMLGRASTDNDYIVEQYKITRRYDRSNKSEYSCKFIFFFDNHDPETSANRIKIKDIHRNDLNHLFYDNLKIWQFAAWSSLATVGMVTYEHDWWASSKKMKINGTSVGCQAKYATDWYQKFSFPYDGADHSNSANGYIKMKSDLACTDCPPGYMYDGANCYSGVQAPAGYNIFIWGTSFYVQSNCTISSANNCCPAGFGWDTANCHSGVQIPVGWTPFVWNNGFYVQPSCE